MRSETMANELLIDQATYLEAGIHIGTKIKTPGMKRFIYKIREDGLYLLELNVIDQKIRQAAKLLAQYEPKDIVVTASRIYAIASASKFAEITKSKLLTGRVVPGIFTNPNREDFHGTGNNSPERYKEREAGGQGGEHHQHSDNSTVRHRQLDKVRRPCGSVQQQGKTRSRPGLLPSSREFLKEKGLIKSNEEFNYKVSDFEARVEMKAK